MLFANTQGCVGDSATDKAPVNLGKEIASYVEIMLLRSSFTVSKLVVSWINVKEALHCADRVPWR